MYQCGKLCGKKTVCDTVANEQLLNENEQVTAV